jgi:hypothetical protein
MHGVCGHILIDVFFTAVLADLRWNSLDDEGQASAFQGNCDFARMCLAMSTHYAGHRSLWKNSSRFAVFSAVSAPGGPCTAGGSAITESISSKLESRV